MRERLDNIRTPEKRSGKYTAVAAAVCFAVGVLLGIISKWLDNLAFDDLIWWHGIIERLDLNNFFSAMAIWLLMALIIAVFSPSAGRAALNVFLFFAGMCVAYHIYTILFSGFDPSSYMMIWYGITLASPVLAVLCWYARGKGAVPVVMDLCIMSIFSLACFGLGLFYIDPLGILYVLVYLAAVIVLYRDPKQTAISIIGGFLLAFLLNPLWPYH